MVPFGDVLIIIKILKFPVATLKKYSELFYLHFSLREINRLTQTKLRNALGIPHSFPLSHFLSIPFIS